MTGQESPGLLRRMLTALCGALERGILGKSSHEYMKQFTGSDEYWARAIAAQRGWPQKQPPKPDLEPEYEPVHGWTKLQLAEYLARNPAYRSTYDAELQKHPNQKDGETERCEPKNYERRPKSERGHTNIRRRSRKMRRSADISSGSPNGVTVQTQPERQSQVKQPERPLC
jgi:hypothetical protein